MNIQRFFCYIADQTVFLQTLQFHIVKKHAAAAKLLQSCSTLYDPIDGSPTGSPIPGILQARTLEWVAISFFNAWKWKVKMKSCPTPSNPMDCSLPGSSTHGIFQARVLEWGAIAFSDIYVYIYTNTHLKPPLAILSGEGNGTPLQYSCLENPMDGGAW